MSNRSNSLSTEWSKEELEHRMKLRKEFEFFDKAISSTMNIGGQEAFAHIKNYENALYRLNTQIASRINKELFENKLENFDENRVSKLRFPVALFFLRGDRAGSGAALVKQVISSFDYWNIDSGKDIDIFLPGWKKDSKLHFDVIAFFEFRLKIEEVSKWEYSGETDILLLDFDYNIEEKEGKFCFDQTITLCVEKMLRDKLIGSIDGLMHSVIKAAKETCSRGVWEISDKIGIQTFRRSLWNYVKKRFLGNVDYIYNELRPYAICNLEK